MKEFRPSYYDQFHCIASACTDSCCHQWEIQVDDAAADYYRSLPGALGDKLRSALTEEDGETCFINENGRCPMWRDDGLCSLQAQLGEQALCRTCREFPRLRHDFGDFAELGLELSCPEAARLILSAGPGPFLVREAQQTEEPDYDEEAMAILLRTRREALSLLNGDPAAAGARLLLYGYAVQEELDGGEEAELPSDLEQIRPFAGQGDMEGMFAFLQTLDILTDTWAARLKQAPVRTKLPPETLPLLGYFVNRYWLQAVSDYDLVCRVKFMVACALLITALGGDYLATAQLLSKEIENSADNLDALLDAMYAHSAFTDAQILGLLLF